MRYLNKLLYILAFLAYSIKGDCQKPLANPYRIDFFNGYVVDLTFVKSGMYPLIMTVMIDTCDFVDDCKSLTVNKAVKYFVKKSHIIPLQISSERIMFEQLCGKLDKKLFENILRDVLKIKRLKISQ